MNGQPGEELDGQPLAGEHRAHGAQHQTVVEQQQDHRHAEGGTQRKAQHADAGVVLKQKRGESGQLFARRRRVEQRLGKYLAARGRRSALRRLRIHERLEPGAVGGGDRPASGDADHHQRGRQRNGPAHRAHRGRQLKPKKAHQQRAGAVAHAVHHEVGAAGQRLQIGDEIGVQGNAPRHRQGRRASAVEAWNLQQLIGLQAGEATPFSCVQKALQRLPPLLSLFAKAVAGQLVFGHQMRSRFLMPR